MGRWPSPIDLCGYLDRDGRRGDSAGVRGGKDIGGRGSGGDGHGALRIHWTISLDGDSRAILGFPS